MLSKFDVDLREKRKVKAQFQDPVNKVEKIEEVDLELRKI